MADSPVSVHTPGTMAQAAVAATAPEGDAHRTNLEASGCSIARCLSADIDNRTTDRKQILQLSHGCRPTLYKGCSVCITSNCDSPYIILALLQIYRTSLWTKPWTKSNENCNRPR